MAQGTGGLIVVGSARATKIVDAVTTGGFVARRCPSSPHSDLPSSPRWTAVSSWTIKSNLGMIVAANVHFMPDPAHRDGGDGHPRFRTAERIARPDRCGRYWPFPRRVTCVRWSSPRTVQVHAAVGHRPPRRGQPTAPITGTHPQAVRRGAGTRLDRYEVGRISCPIRDVVAVIQRAAVIREHRPGFGCHRRRDRATRPPSSPCRRKALAEGVYRHCGSRQRRLPATQASQGVTQRVPKARPARRGRPVQDRDAIAVTPSAITNLDQAASRRVGSVPSPTSPRLPDQREGCDPEALRHATTKLCPRKHRSARRGRRRGHGRVAKTIRSYLKRRQGLAGGDLGV